jgi:hypothetical protein
MDNDQNCDRYARLEKTLISQLFLKIMHEFVRLTT